MNWADADPTDAYPVRAGAGPDLIRPEHPEHFEHFEDPL